MKTMQKIPAIAWREGRKPYSRKRKKQLVIVTMQIAEPTTAWMRSALLQCVIKYRLEAT